MQLWWSTIISSPSWTSVAATIGELQRHRGADKGDSPTRAATRPRARPRPAVPISVCPLVRAPGGVGAGFQGDKPTLSHAGSASYLMVSVASRRVGSTPLPIATLRAFRLEPPACQPEGVAANPIIARLAPRGGHERDELSFLRPRRLERKRLRAAGYQPRAFGASAKAIPPSTRGPIEGSLSAARSFRGGKDAEKQRADLDHPCRKPAAAFRPSRNIEGQRRRPILRQHGLSRAGEERRQRSRGETSCGWDRHLGRRRDGQGRVYSLRQ